MHIMPEARSRSAVRVELLPGVKVEYVSKVHLWTVLTRPEYWRPCSPKSIDRIGDLTHP